MKLNCITKIVSISTREFTEAINEIRKIFQTYHIREEYDKQSDEFLFFFYDETSWKVIKKEIQLKVGEVVFTSQAKYVKINWKMRSTIIDDKPPKWFIEWNNTQFQPFVKQINDRIDNLVKLNNLKE
jgi:hypothetical protein